MNVECLLHATLWHTISRGSTLQEYLIHHETCLKIWHRTGDFKGKKKETLFKYVSKSQRACLRNSPEELRADNAMTPPPPPSSRDNRNPQCSKNGKKIKMKTNVYSGHIGAFLNCAHLMTQTFLELNCDTA